MREEYEYKKSGGTCGIDISHYKSVSPAGIKPRRETLLSFNQNPGVRVAWKLSLMYFLVASVWNIFTNF